MSYSEAGGRMDPVVDVMGMLQQLGVPSHELGNKKTKGLNCRRSLS